MSWEELHQSLQPTPPLFCPEEPSLTQKVFLKTNSLEAIFGGSAGGGKSSALLMAGLQYVDVPGYTAIFFRRTYADLALPGALMDRFLDWIKDYDDVRWNANTFTATFPSGARVTFGYLNNVNDRLRYKSAEFQYIGMDEVTEIREEDYRYLFSRLRRPKSGPLSQVPLRMRAASNPAPNWVRQRFIVEGEEKGRVFVRSTLDDNPGIDQESYRRSLQELDDVERARLEKGDWWATSAGSMFQREKFVIIGSEELPDFEAPRLIRFWDLAATEPSASNKDPDWTVGVLMLVDKGIYYVLDVTRFREEADEVERRVAETAEEDGPHVEIKMEQEPGSSGKTVGFHYARNILSGYNFTHERASGDKVVRAKPLKAAVNNGTLKLVRGAWLTDFLDEITAFPEAADHDDQVDGTTGAFNELSGLGAKLKKKIRIIV